MQLETFGDEVMKVNTDPKDNIFSSDIWNSTIGNENENENENEKENEKENEIEIENGNGNGNGNENALPNILFKS